MMSRSLRSYSRLQKLQVQQFKQVDNEIRVNINNCTATKIESFEQREFLSLFGLIPNKQQNGKNKIRKSISVRRPIKNIVNVRRVLRKRPIRTNDDTNNNHCDIRPKRKITIGKEIWCIISRWHGCLSLRLFWCKFFFVLL